MFLLVVFSSLLEVITHLFSFLLIIHWMPYISHCQPTDILQYLGTFLDATCGGYYWHLMDKAKNSAKH